MNNIIANAFKALEDLVEDIKIEPVKSKRLKEAEEFQKDELENPTIKDLFMEAGAYVLTKEFEKDGLTYFLFVEGTANGEAADLQFEEFDIDNIDGFLVEILDEERNFINDISLKEIKDALEEAEGNDGEKEIPFLETPVEKVIEVAKEQIDTGEAPVATEELKEKPEEHKEEVKKEEEPKKEETLQLTGFNEAAETSKFFPGEDGDIAAGDFILEKDLEGYRIEWDGAKGGYLVSWGHKPVEEAKAEGSQRRIRRDRKPLPKHAVVKKEELKESTQFDLRDKEDIQKAKEIVDDNKEETPIEQIVDVNAETVEDLKKSYIGSTILQCSVCRTLIYKDPKDLVKPEGETAEGEKLYNEGEACPHCGAKDGFELIGQVASLEVNPEEKPEPPMVEPQAEVKPEEVKPEGEQPVEEPKEEKPVETIEPVQPEEKQVDLVPEEPKEETEQGPEEETEEDKKKKKKVPLIPEETMEESLKEEPQDKGWGVKQEVEHYVYKRNPQLVVGFIEKELTQEEAEKKAKEMNTEKLNKAGVFYSAAKVEEPMNEKYQEVILEKLDESKFDRLAKKYLNEVYDNIESYSTQRGTIDNESNKIIIEGKVTFKSGKVKDTKFVFEAREITKKGKIKLVGINETFTKKKAFTLVASVEGNNMLSESLTYSYKIEDKKVYGQVKNPTKI